MSRATSRCLLSVLLLTTYSGLALAERKEQPVVENWVAPASWSPDSSLQASAKREASIDFSHPVPFIPLTPCRLADTRGNGFGGAFGPPSMAPGMARNFPAAGNCGIPPDAAAISFNFTVARTQGLGYLLVYPAGGMRPGTSTLNYVAGQVIANSSVVAIGDAGAITVEVAGSQADLIIDVNGYYGGPLVTSVNGMSGNLTVVAGENVTVTQTNGTLTLSALPGPTGPQGPMGPAGPRGAVGSVGAQGTAGATGSIGATGAAGPQGQQGPPVKFRGTWDLAVTYMIGDAVWFNGSSYISLIDDNTGHSPPFPTRPAQLKSQVVPWALLARQGAPGSEGAPGAQGLQGPQGLTGNPGPRGPSGSGGYQSFHDLGGASGVLYLSPLTSWSGPTELGKAIALIPKPCTMTSLSVFVDSPAAAGAPEIYTLRAGTSIIVTGESSGSDLTDQELTCTVHPDTQSCTADGAVALAAGQLFDLKVDFGNGGAPTPHDAVVAVVCE